MTSHAAIEEAPDAESTAATAQELSLDDKIDFIFQTMIGFSDMLHVVNTVVMPMVKDVLPLVQGLSQNPMVQAMLASSGIVVDISAAD